MNESSHDKRLAQLLIGLTDGNLSDAHLAELRERVQSDAHCRAAYIDHMTMHAMLEFRHGGTEVQPQRTETESLLLEVLEQERVARIKREAAAALEKQQSDDRQAERRESMRRLAGLSKPDTGTQTRHYVIPRPLFYGSIAAVVAIAAAIIWPMFQSNTNPGTQSKPNLVQPHEPILVAKIIEQTDALWEDASNTFGVGSDVFDDATLRLYDGLARVRFENGAEVLMDGPCVIKPISTTELRLIEGQVVGICETESSKGFVISAKGARVVDLGTEFGVKLNTSGRPEAHVFRGEVFLEVNDDVKITNGSRRTKLAAGQAGIINGESGIVVRPSVSAQFTRTSNRRDQLFARLNRKILNDNPLIYYRFDGSTSDDVHNLAADDRHAMMFGPYDIKEQPFTTWRLNKGTSTRREDVPHVRLNGGLNAFRDQDWSVELWFNVSPAAVRGVLFNLRMQRGITGSYGAVWYESPGSMYSTSDSFPQIRVANQNIGEEKTNFLTEQSTIEPGRWHHAIVTTQNGMTMVYVDGQLAATGPELPVNGDPDALFIGCLRDDSPVGKVTGGFTGEIAAVAVYTNGFDEDRVQRHWEMTKPVFGH